MVVKQYLFTAELWRSYHGPVGALHAQRIKDASISLANYFADCSHPPRAAQVLAGL